MSGDHHMAIPSAVGDLLDIAQVQALETLATFAVDHRDHADDMELEMANLMSATEEAYELEQWTAVVLLTAAREDVVVLHSHWSAWERDLGLARTAARHLGDPLTEARALSSLAAVLNRQSRWRDAEDCARQSLRIHQRLKD